MEEIASTTREQTLKKQQYIKEYWYATRLIMESPKGQHKGDKLMILYHETVNRIKKLQQ